MTDPKPTEPKPTDPTATDPTATDPAEDGLTQPTVDLSKDDDETAADETATDETATDETAFADYTAEPRGIDWARVTAYGLLPGLVLVLALVAGLLKFSDSSSRNGAEAGIEAAQAAKDGTVTILSYTPDKVEAELNEARNLLTGEFRESYTELINNVVIPGAKQQQISAVATVPAVASVSATSEQAVALVFVNQTVSIGGTPPTSTASSVRVTLDKVGEKWLISQFQPV